MTRTLVTQLIKNHLTVKIGWDEDNCNQRGYMDNDIHQALSHVQRRRKLLALLKESPQDESPIYLNNPPDDPIRRDLDRHKMRSVHLRLLDKQRFINWNVGEGEVAKGPRFDDLTPLLEHLKEQEDLLYN